jgi:hypothetical protein
MTEMTEETIKIEAAKQAGWDANREGAPRNAPSNLSPALAEAWTKGWDVFASPGPGKPPNSAEEEREVLEQARADGLL